MKKKMALVLILGIGRDFRKKQTSSLGILSSKRVPSDHYKGKNCKPTGFHMQRLNHMLHNHVIEKSKLLKLQKRPDKLMERNGVSFNCQLPLGLATRRIERLEN